MSARRGRPAKCAKKNISGLKNQPSSSRPASLPDSLAHSPTRSPSPAESLDDYSDAEIPDSIELDSLTYLEVDTDHNDSDNEADWDEVAVEDFNSRLLGMLAQIEEDRYDAQDDDWIPSQQAYEAKRTVERRNPEVNQVVQKNT
ncbi:hypothetical protein FB451DRAFT_1169017 [Mycena latifolia]|nr:hypothetical protein FB451DRAFT_1169017 [Mycena latifolia]